MTTKESVDCFVVECMTCAVDCSGGLFTSTGNALVFVWVIGLSGQI